MWGKERGHTKRLEWCRVHEILDFKVLAATSSRFAIFQQHFKVSQPRVRISPSSNSILGQQEAISQEEIMFRFRNDIQSLRKAGVLIFCA